MVESKSNGAEFDLEPDYSPVDSEVLRTYPLPPESTICNGPPVSIIGPQEVRTQTPIKDSTKMTRKYKVEVEYRANSAIETTNFRNYLKTYEMARISQEALVQGVHKHLRNLLDTDDVFVEVRSIKDTGKRTRIGSVL